jgi:hypothetical protein
MGASGEGVAGTKKDLKNSLDKLSDLNYIVEEMIASPSYPDLVRAYWKGSLTQKTTASDTQQRSKLINYRGGKYIPHLEWKNG